MKEGYKKTELGEIPVDWEVVKIDNICSVTKLAGFEFTQYIDYSDDGEIIALRALNLKNGKLDLNDTKRIKKTISDKLKRSKLYKDDIVFSYVGTVGEVAIVSKSNKYHLAPNVAKITSNNNNFTNFIYHYLTSNFAKKEISKYLTTTSQPALSMSNIRQLRIVLPSLLEQRKIASILSKVDKHIEETDALIERTKELKKGLMQKLLTKGIGHTEFKKTEVGEIPVEWKVKKLSNLANIKRGASPRPIKDKKWFSNNKEVGWIRISDVTKTKKYLRKTQQYLSEEGIAKSRLVNKGDLIMSICATVGKPILIDMKACIHDGFVVFDNLNNDLAIKEYVFYYLQKQEGIFKSKGQTGTQSNINTSIVGITLINLPPLAEQKKIVNILKEVDNQIEEYEKKHNRLTQVKQGLMQQLLTGKKRVI
ncbi:restriction endonuclease subunit S [Vallitalea longa]|uniref:Restriction endonuclease subunit S n=1 Tax=Vallitalea longa TaxID=2936439 RepID=A0A9W5YI59_9FIRM|nr:restriction endonuclease subunit S [Vallitalea longa]GKX32364.1 restriction endonuclease subunit S [Vallitalea longa]